MDDIVGESVADYDQALAAVADLVRGQPKAVVMVALDDDDDARILLLAKPEVDLRNFCGYAIKAIGENAP